MRTAIGAISGILLAFAIVYLVEMLGHAIYPPPAGIEVGDYESMRKAMDAMPAAALLFVLAAWTLAALFGGLLAGVVAQRRHRILAAVVGGLIMAGAIANMILLPHPVWFVVAAVVLIPLATWLAAVFSKKLVPGSKPA